MNIARFLIELRLGWFAGLAALAFVVIAYCRRREVALLFLGAAIVTFLVARVFDVLALEAMMERFDSKRSLFGQNLRLGPGGRDAAEAGWRNIASALKEMVAPAFVLGAAILFAMGKALKPGRETTPPPLPAPAAQAPREPQG